ncbi:pentapeptide repeat-containing protein [Bradyrhizobium sp.]|uniref:pentapeptide repeat-containing protein n=1 Tax=Bradyrhizobium sp. TaxID=376 RepID=UPI003C4BDD74
MPRLKFNILRPNRSVQFVAEIDCAADDSLATKLGLAVKSAVKRRANLSGADLSGADLSGANLSSADLNGANLCSADLSGAYLWGANLISANLSSADLSGANLSSADLNGADLNGAKLISANLSSANLGSQWIIQGSTRSDGYAFFLQKLTGDTEPMVKAGCRLFTLREAQEHWEKTRAGTAILTETRAIVRCMVDLAYARKLIA